MGTPDSRGRFLFVFDPALEVGMVWWLARKCAEADRPAQYTAQGRPPALGATSPLRNLPTMKGPCQIMIISIYNLIRRLESHRLNRIQSLRDSFLEFCTHCLTHGTSGDDLHLESCVSKRDGDVFGYLSIKGSCANS